LCGRARDSSRAALEPSGISRHSVVSSFPSFVLSCVGFLMTALELSNFFLILKTFFGAAGGLYAALNKFFFFFFFFFLPFLLFFFLRLLALH
jgi:hypothetical protein